MSSNRPSRSHITSGLGIPDTAQLSNAVSLMMVVGDVSTPSRLITGATSHTHQHSIIIIIIIISFIIIIANYQ